MKEWPKDGSPVSFEEIVVSLRKALLFGYKVERKNKDQDIPWDGLNIGPKELSTCLSPEEALTAEMLAYDEEDQNRDLLDVVLQLAVQLGIEQGRRLAHEESKK